MKKKAFEMLKKEFPNENVMQIPAKYSNLKENYLDYLEQRVKSNISNGKKREYCRKSRKTGDRS